MTQKDADLLIRNFKRKGFKIVRGYCCYTKDGLDTSDLILLGSNIGKEGWNYSIHLHPYKKTIYISGYRKYMELGE